MRRHTDGCLLYRGYHIVDWAFSAVELERVMDAIDRLLYRRWERGNRR